MDQRWSEEDSTFYRQIAAIGVPEREEQIATLLALLPYGREQQFRAVELGCGEGALSYAVLHCFPRASVLALDGSRAMRERAAAVLAPFGDRARVEPFDLNSAAWLPQLDGAGCVLSSLCLHHLPGERKQELFRAVAGRISPQGALLIADLVEPQRPEARELFADTWDEDARSQSHSKTGSLEWFEVFRKIEWNYYRFPDAADQPSPLFDQLCWLRDAGFAVVDCFWMRAGHALYGGYTSGTRPGGESVTWADARRSAQAALRVLVMG